MRSVSGKTLCKVVDRHGWVLKRVSGSHHIYTKSDSTTILVIPVHGNRDLPIGTIKAILKDANLTEDDLG